MMHSIIDMTPELLPNEHVCCAIGNTPKDRACAAQKKAWMETEFSNGYRFFRLDARGKVLIETTPAERAWAPVDARDWLFIDCFWVSGQFKGQGLATRLLQAAVDRAKDEGKKGLCAVSTVKKRGFISDASFYRHKGFLLADTAPPDYELLALPLQKDAALPQFKPCVKAPAVPGQGLYLVYSQHCPYTGLYMEVLQKAAKRAGVPFQAVKLESFQQAQAAPNPFTTWAIFGNGRFLTNEILSDKKAAALLETLAGEPG